MKCPNCNKEVANDKNYCEFCGSPLYGPRSIDWNSFNNNTNHSNNSKSNKNNNIKSITGIDINEIAINSINETNAYSNQNNNDKKTFNIKKYLNLILIIIIIFLLCIILVLIINNHNLKNNKNNDNNTISSCIEGYYGITSIYKFYMPNDYIYGENTDNIVLTNNNISILIYNYSLGHLDSVNISSLVNEYYNQGYKDTTSEENILNNHKIYYLKYTTSGISFTDFYYQYDSEKIIYGQISSSSTSDLITENIKKIISSLIINNDNNNISISKAPINYDNILKIFN